MSAKPAPAPAANPAANLPFWKTFVAGGTAGLTECLIMYPTDVLKTRAQLSTTRLTMVECTRQIIKNEGVGTFYRGISAPLLAEAPKRAIKFATNAQYKNLLRGKDGHLSNTGAACAGGMAGATEALLNCPFEVVKIRMQAAENKALYKSTLDCATKIFQQEGVLKGLYKGIESQIWRNGVWNATYFGVIGTVGNMMPPPAGASKSDRQLHSLMTGCCAGALATCFNTPFDVVKSRIQNQVAGVGAQYVWAIPSLVRVASEEGVRSLYKGLAPKLLRLGPGGGIMAVMFDTVVEFLN
jgi:solute carrier family 25 2-oxodicarboxylate transporter 21